MSLDQEQFLKLYDENVGSIYRYIFLRVNSKETAQDLCSEVFLKSWQYLNQKQDLKSPRAFFYQVARNLLKDFYRRKPQKPISLEEIPWQIPDLNNNPAAKTYLDLELQPIKEALSRIKKDYAEVIIWHYLDDLSISEIAQILKKREGAIRVMLHRGLNALRNELAKV